MSDNKWKEQTIDIELPMNVICYKDGNLAGFTIGLVERYGDGIISGLNALKHATYKMTKSDYEEIIKLNK